jgi:hypothetical protein
MYPLDVFNLFPPFPRNDNAFVAMSFDKKSDNRWENVIEPAIREVGLEPYRVDKKTISDSIFTEIVSEIANCRLFFADVTAFGKYDDRPLRNENVLYEVGIAHSRRLAEEVILFRSDNEKLMFDLANIRVNHYNPNEEPEEAKKFLIEALQSAITEIKLQKHLSVQIAVDSLTDDSWKCLLETVNTNGIVTHPARGNMGEVLVAIERTNSINQLLELGILSSNYPNVVSGLFVVGEELSCDNDLYNNRLSYEITSFGNAVRSVILNKSKPTRIT